MSPRREAINRDLVERVRRIVLERYRIISRNHYVEVEPGVVVSTALTDDEIEELLLLALKEARQPVSWRELKKIFAGIAGEDRLRKVLSRLKANNVIAELTKTRYAMPEYVSEREIDKVKNPGIISKILRIKGSR